MTLYLIMWGLFFIGWPIWWLTHDNVETYVTTFWVFVTSMVLVSFITLFFFGY